MDWIMQIMFAFHGMTLWNLIACYLLLLTETTETIEPIPYGLQYTKVKPYLVQILLVSFQSE